MIKSEINEIKSLYDTIQDCGIARLCGCYVDGNKEKVKTFNETFLTLEDDEVYKYMEIFRKTLSGTQGKNLIDLTFVDAEDTAENSGKSLLTRLRKSELKDDDLLDSFYGRIIDAYNYIGNYLILLIYQSYDVPGITGDNIEMEDASEEVYSYILCSICPMKLTKPGLGYDDALQKIHTLKQSFGVELPETGFLFPAFNDRSADDTQILYYTKKADALQDRLLDEVLSVSAPLPAKQQKEGFNTFVASVLGDASDIETMISLQENLSTLVREKREESSGGNIVLEKEAVKNVFEKSGVDGERLHEFEKKFDEQFDMKAITEKNSRQIIQDEEAVAVEAELPRLRVEPKIFAENVVPTRNFEVKTADMLLRINTKHLDIINTRVLDGKKCLVIELSEDATVNGIPVS